MIETSWFYIFVLTSNLLVVEICAQGYAEQKPSSSEAQQGYQQQAETPKQGYGTSKERTAGYGAQSGQQIGEHQTTGGGGGLKAFKYTKSKEEYEVYKPIPDNNKPGHGAQAAATNYGPQATTGYGAASTPGYGPIATPALTPGYGQAATQGYIAASPPGFGSTSTPGYGAPEPLTHPPTYPPPVFPTMKQEYSGYNGGETINPYGTPFREPSGYSSVERIDGGYRNTQSETPSTMARHLYFTTTTPRHFYFTTSTKGYGYSPTRPIEVSPSGYTVAPPSYSRPNEPQQPAYPGPQPTVGYETTANRYGAETRPTPPNPYQAAISIPYQTLQQQVRSEYKPAEGGRATESSSTPFHPEFGYPFYGDGKFWYFKIPTNQLRNSAPTNAPYPPPKEPQEKNNNYKSEPSITYKFDRK